MQEGRTEEDTIELCKSAIAETALVQLNPNFAVEE